MIYFRYYYVLAIKSLNRVIFVFHRYHISMLNGIFTTLFNVNLY